jgi:hypothetical protein
MNDYHMKGLHLTTLSARLYLRNFSKNRLSNLVAITGLALGMMIAILTVSYIVFEYSYDTFHSRSGRIYTIYTRITVSGSDAVSYAVESGINDYIGSEIPDIEIACIVKGLNTDITCDNTLFKGIAGYLTEPGFFRMFDFRLLTGNPESLSEPGNVFLTEGLSERIFGTTNSAGRVVSVKDRLYTVAGIMEDPPVNSNLKFDFLLPVRESEVKTGAEYGRDKVNLYIMTRKEKVRPDILKSRLDGYFISAGRNSERCEVIRLRDLHRYGPDADTSIIVLISVSILVLFISIVNFVNCYLAQVESRTREMGMRKVSGASGSKIVIMLVTDSLVTMFLASITGYVLSTLSLGYFRQLTSTDVQFYGPGLWKIQAVVIALAVVLGIIAGLIVSVRYSRENPVNLIRGITGRLYKRNIRKTFIGLQFAISGGLIFLMVVVFLQLNLLRNANMGFDPHNRLLIRLSPVHSLKYDMIRSELMNMNGIDNVTGRGSIFSNVDMAMSVTWGDDAAANRLFILGYNVKNDFFGCYGIRLVEGKTFSDFSGRDSSRIIIDRYTAGILGLEHPVGTKLHGGGMTMEIVGLVEDAGFTALSSKKMPAVYTQFQDNCAEMTVKYHGDAKGIMTGINSLLTQLDPEYTFEYMTLDEAVAGLYEEEANLLRITGICGIIAIILSLSGVYAMAVWFAKRKTREYSIRKVFGASELNITALSVSQIMWPVVAGTLLPWPAVFLIAKHWLSHFSAKITIGLLPFIISMAAVALLVLLTVYSVSRRSALENPADILRQE